MSITSAGADLQKLIDAKANPLPLRVELFDGEESARRNSALLEESGAYKTEVISRGKDWLVRVFDAEQYTAAKDEK